MSKTNDIVIVTSLPRGANKNPVVETYNENVTFVDAISFIQPNAQRGRRADKVIISGGLDPVLFEKVREIANQILHEHADRRYRLITL